MMATQSPSCAAADLYETDSKPDPSATAAGEAYTYHLNSQGNDFEHYDFLDLSQSSARSAPPPAPALAPVAASSSSLPAPLPPPSGADLAPQDAPTRPDPSSSPSPWSASKARSSAAGGLAAGVAALSLEEPPGTGVGEDGNHYGKGTFVDDTCWYCGIHNSACVTRCNLTGATRARRDVFGCQPATGKE